MCLNPEEAFEEASEQDIKDYKLTKEIQNIVDTSAVQGRVEMTPAISSAVSYALTALSTRDGELFPANLVALDNFIPLQQVRHTFANLVSICGIINNIRAPNQYYHNRAIDDRNQEAYDLISAMIHGLTWNSEKKRYEFKSNYKEPKYYNHLPLQYYRPRQSSQPSSSERIKSFISFRRR